MRPRRRSLQARVCSARLCGRYVARARSTPGKARGHVWSARLRAHRLLRTLRRLTVAREAMWSAEATPPLSNSCGKHGNADAPGASALSDDAARTATLRSWHPNSKAEALPPHSITRAARLGVSIPAPDRCARDHVECGGNTSAFGILTWVAQHTDSEASGHRSRDARPLQTTPRFQRGLNTSGIGLSSVPDGISRLKRSIAPSTVQVPSLHADCVSIGFPSRMRSAFAVASRSAR